MQGVISSDTTWSGTVTMVGDVRVDAPAKLTIAAGTTVNVATTDAANLGTDSARVELLINGTLDVQGTAGSRVTFTTSGSSGAWYGIKVQAGSTANLIANAFIEKATVGLTAAGPVTVSGTRFHNNATGAQASGGTLTLNTCTFTSAGSYGVYHSSGTTSVDHSTFDGNFYAVYAPSGSTGTFSVTASILTNNTYGLARSSSGANITNSFNDVWGNSTNYSSVTAGTGSFSSNPLYVDRAAQNFRLTSHSPARRADAMSMDLGPLPYVSDATVGLQGTFFTDATLSGAQTILGDITVAPGVTVTIAPGATLSAAASDSMVAGNNTSQVEIVVRGTLQVTGNTSSAATLTTAGSSGSWQGVRVETGGSATFSYARVEKAGQGVTATGNATIANSTFDANNTGVQTSGGTVTVATSLFRNQGSYGLYHVSGSLSVDHCTLDGNFYAVYAPSGSSGTASVTNSILTNNTYGLARSSSGVNITNSFNDVWGNSTNYSSVTAGTSSFSSNPLYVNRALQNFRLTSHSPARRADSMGNDVGAFPYVSDATVGLQGTFFSNTTLSGAQTILGDITVAPGVTLTLAAGATLSAAASDSMVAGNNTSQVEIVVNGTLVVSGSAGSVATLTTSGSSGSWQGVRVEAGGSATFSYARVEKASQGVTAVGNATITNSTFDANNTGVQTSGGTVTVATSLFRNQGSYGLYHVSGSLSVDHCTLDGNFYAVYAPSGSSGTASVTNSILTNNTYGLARSSSGVNITNSFNDVWGNSTNYSSVTAGTSSFSSNPLYVDRALQNFRLTSRSPARRADSMGADLGAFPYVSDATVGLQGTFFTDTTLSGTQTILGDITVASGVTLTIAAGATLSAAASDSMVAGNNTSRVEIIVNGTLSVAGSAGNVATLTTSGAAGSWEGVRVEAGRNATLTHARVEKASVGVLAVGNASVTNSTFDGNTTAVQTSGGTVTVATSLFRNQGSYAAYHVSGSLSVDHSTLDGNFYAVYAPSGSTGTLSVTNSILTNNTYGLARSSSGANVTNSFNDVWGNSTNYSSVTAGSGSFSSNPLYVDRALQNFRLTSRSPGRRADSVGGDLGAFPYVSDATVGLQGVFFTDTTLSGAQTILGDITVAPGVTLTVAPGATLSAAASDTMVSGSNTSRVEVIVNGTLQVAGTAGNLATLTTSGAAGSWEGVRVENGRSASFTFARVERASVGINALGTVTVSNSHLHQNNTAVQTTGGSSNVSFTLITNSGSYGVYHTSGATVMDHLTLDGNFYAVYVPSGSSGTASIMNSLVTNNTYGLARSSSGITLTNSYNDVWGNSTNFSSVTQGSNTLSVDPQYVARASLDFHLTSGSPARGVGTSGSDLGAFPFQPGAVDHITVSPSSVSVGAGGQQTFTATAYDAANNVVPTAVFTWAAAPGAGTITSGGVLTAGCSTGAFPMGVTATVGSVSGTASVTIVPGPVASLTVSPASATVKSGATQSFTVSARDACNNVLASPTVTWGVVGSAGAITQGGVFTAGCTRGPFSNAIVATAGSVTGTASVTVDPGDLAAVSVAPSAASLAPMGMQQFTATASDTCGNPVSPTLGWTTSVPGASVTSGGLFTAGTMPGTYPGGLTVTATQGAIVRTSSANVTVTGGSVSRVAVSPALATLSPGGTAAFTAQAFDAFNNPVAGTATWTVAAGGGAINAAGVFTAGNTAGTFTDTVTATVAGVSGTATVVVQPGPVARVTVAPAMATLAPGGNTTFTAQAFDAFNNAVASTFTWAAQAAAGTITQGGNFTAGTMAGNYPNAVTASVGTVSGSASVTINPGALSQLTISPSTVTLQAGGTAAFSAAGRDGSGNPVAVTPTWSVVSGGGAITSAGVFTAGSTTGTFANTVRAEANGLTAFATVTVTAGALVRIDVTPASVQLLPGGTQQFSAQGFDAFNNQVPVSPTWSALPAAGTVTPAGLFTAGATPGTYASAVAATQGGAAGSASVTVLPTVMPDAGMEDAGVPTDGGTESDAGTEADAGMTADAGTTPDAGGMQPDGGSGIVGGPSGCGCTAVDPLFPVAMLGVLLLRRRRR
ncbi:MAG: right-handed parallel beta-helix repeat-containing protein [Myxococcota bacterium]